MRSSARPKPRALERELHAAVAKYLCLALKPPTTWTTFPAGGGGLARGKMLARLGLRPGWPDIIVLHPAPASAPAFPYSIVLGIELKAEDGRLSKVQRSVREELWAAGAGHYLCRSLEDVERALRSGRIPVHAHVARDAA